MTLMMNDAGQVWEPLSSSEVRPVVVWEDGPEGRRRTDRQEADAAGQPLWEIDVVLTQVKWGRKVPEIAALRWAGDPVIPGTITVRKGE